MRHVAHCAIDAIAVFNGSFDKLNSIGLRDGAAVTQRPNTCARHRRSESSLSTRLTPTFPVAPVTRSCIDLSVRTACQTSRQTATSRLATNFRLKFRARRLLTCEGHAAVFLVFEGLIEIEAVSEIRAAVGYEEGDVDLLL